MIRLNAHLGLAAVAEGQGQIEEAQRHYHAVVEQAGSGYETIAAQATAKLDGLDALRTPIYFADDPALEELAPIEVQPDPEPAVAPESDEDGLNPGFDGDEPVPADDGGA